jgi:hypothetical protein
MRVVHITESQFKLLESEKNPNPLEIRKAKVEDEKHELENYIEAHGEYMIDITNNKLYLVQPLKALSRLLGKDYVMCAPVKGDDTYAAFYVKPLSTFQDKDMSAMGNMPGLKTVPMAIKPNLYQRMQMNK